MTRNIARSPSPDVSGKLQPTLKQTIYILTFLLLTSCGQSNSEKTTPIITDTTSISRNANTTNIVKPNIVELNETFNKEDLPVNDYLTERLKPIRANFKRINSIKNWTDIVVEELFESTEGGEAKYYYKNGRLEKIVARHYGETFQLLVEYYLLEGQLSFAFEKLRKYNRSLYYDTTAMRANNDTEAFDLSKSEIIEDRSYFEKGRLLHQINNEDCGSPLVDNYLLEEQERIKADFSKLMAKKPNR